MCLAVPLKLISVEGEYGVVESAGVRVPVNLNLVEEAKVGDYVIVHTGFALSVMVEEEARLTLDLLQEYIEKSKAEWNSES